MIRSLQVFWGLGVAAWNAYGMYQLQQGAAPPGPTSSWAVAVVGLLIALAFGLRWLDKQRWVYILVCLVCAALGAVIIYGSFTKDPSLWPSEAWRWGGIILNGIGAAACIAGALKMYQHKAAI